MTDDERPRTYDVITRRMRPMTDDEIAEWTAKARSRPATARELADPYVRDLMVRMDLDEPAESEYDSDIESTIDSK